MSDLPASWQSDPTGRHDHRYWDGTRWTDHVADAGVASSDPYPEAEAGAEATTGSIPESTTGGQSEATEPGETGSPVDGGDAALGGDASVGAGDAAAATTATPSGWGRPAEATTPEPDGPTEASPVAGWAPAATTAWSTDPDPTAVTSSIDSPTEVTPVVDHSPLPDLADPMGAGAVGGEPPEADLPGPGPRGGDSTRRNLLIGLALLVVVAVVAFLALSGDDDDSGPSAISSRLADSLQDDSDLSNDDAECVADRIVDQVGAERLEDVDFTSQTAPSGDVGADFVEAYADAVRECDVSSGATTDPDEDDGDLPGGTTDSDVSVPDIGDLDSFRDLLADQYEQTLGLPREKATCLADAMGEAVSNGQLDQQDAFGDFFDYLESCDIALDEITGANP